MSYYNARWYDAQLGRFISADTLIPQPENPQSFNRLAYVENNPLNYSDPTGHCRRKGGKFVYATDCTVDEFDKLSWDDRILWMEMFMEKSEVESFHNIIGILEFFRDDPVFSESKWASYSDAAVLAAIQDGWQAYKKQTPIGTGGVEWETFFEMSFDPGEGETERLQQWGIAEQSGVDYGLELAEQFTSETSVEEYLRINTFVSFGNFYRTLVSGGIVYKTPERVRSWFDPRTPASQGFVREFSQNVIALAADYRYQNYYSAVNNLPGYDWP